MEMLQAEDWLKSNCKKNDWANIEDDLNDALWTNNVVLYMTEYSEYVAQIFIKKQNR